MKVSNLCCTVNNEHKCFTCKKPLCNDHAYMDVATQEQHGKMGIIRGMSFRWYCEECKP